MTRSIAGWKLPPAERDRLLERFAPRYAELVADHVTLRFGTAEDTPLPRCAFGRDRRRSR